jgi:hypothetical protein
MEDTWKLQDIIKKHHIISIKRVVEKAEKESEAPMIKEVKNQELFSKMLRGCLQI